MTDTVRIGRRVKAWVAGFSLEMVNTFRLRLNSIQPSQLYINSEKLGLIMRRLRSRSASFEPIPVKRLGDQVVFVDGHTRAFAAFLLGFAEIPVYWEDEQLDWDEYEVCVRWCNEEGIHTISDLKGRVVSRKEYQILWLDRCAKMQKDLEERRKTQKAPEKTR